MQNNENQNIIIYNSADGNAKVALYAKDGNIWLNQNQLAELFATSKQNVGQHIANILSEKELDENSVVNNYLTTASDGKDYNVTFYSMFDSRRKEFEALQADKNDLKEIENIETNIQKKER